MVPKAKTASQLCPRSAMAISRCPRRLDLWIYWVAKAPSPSNTYERPGHKPLATQSGRNIFPSRRRQRPSSRSMNRPAMTIQSGVPSFTPGGERIFTPHLPAKPRPAATRRNHPRHLRAHVWQSFTYVQTMISPHFAAALWPVVGSIWDRPGPALA